MVALLQNGWTRPVVFTQPPPAIPSEQLALFPRTTLIEHPTSTSADMYRYVTADNGRNYYLKLDQGDKYIRASEWICYRLANLVGVPTPRCDCIQTFNGDIAFGSEDVAGVFSRAETVRYLQTRSMNEIGQPIPGLQSALSAIHAFDLFTRNDDRHYANFLVAGYSDERNLLALDFSRSFFWNWPLAGFGTPYENTSEVWAELLERHGFDTLAALAVVDRLSIVSDAQIASLLDQMPAHWLPEHLRESLLAYCRAGGWKARTHELRQGFESGSIV